MASSTGVVRQRLCSRAEIALGGGDQDGRQWPPGDVLLASVALPEVTHYLLALPEVLLRGGALTGFLARVAPYGCPVPGSLIRAYSLPDAPFPSILLREHEAAPEGIADAYLRFVANSRRDWLAALGESAPGLCPALAWQRTPVRRFTPLDECTGALAEAGIVLPGVPDAYLGRALVLLADPEVAAAWQGRMSLGGVTKIRDITGREFPVWVDLPAHQPDLLASPLLARAEQLLGDA
jgi:hypothetical protein